MQQSAWQWRRSVESPWFYAAWFCLFGAAALLVAGEKYGERQAGIERRFQARSQAITALPREAPPAETPADTAAYSSPDNTVIPLWPIGILLAGMVCAFALFAYRAGLKGGAKGEEAG